MKLNAKEARSSRDATLIVIDERSMMNWKMLNMLDCVLCLLVNCGMLMVGKYVICDGG